jgi:hypothetical protein
VHVCARTKTQRLRFEELSIEADEIGDALKLADRDEALDKVRSGERGGIENGSGPDGDAERAGDGDAPTRWGAQPLYRLYRGDPWALDRPLTTFGRQAGDVLAEQRGRARTAVEKVGQLGEASHEYVTKALDTEHGEALSKIARWAVVTSDPAYLRAFSKLAADPQNGHREWDDRELAAFQRVQGETRAMSLTDASGGFMVPFQLDPPSSSRARAARTRFARSAGRSSPPAMCGTVSRPPA